MARQEQDRLEFEISERDGKIQGYQLQVKHLVFSQKQNSAKLVSLVRDIGHKD